VRRISPRAAGSPASAGEQSSGERNWTDLPKLVSGPYHRHMTDYRAVQVLLYVVAAMLAVATSFYAYG
jgi:hypothetical protein